MKKHKSVVAILLAVMMIFTMMPMMAFADAPSTAKPSFNSDYTKVSYPQYVDDTTGDTIPAKTYDTVRTYTTDGTVKVYADPATSVDWEVPTAYVEYYDLSVAEFADASGNTLKSEYAWGRYTKNSMTQLKLNVPSYVANKADAVAVTLPINSLKSNWTSKAVGDDDFVATKREVQSFTLSLGEGEYDSDIEDDGLVFYGMVQPKAVTVNAPAADPAFDGFYYFDGSEVGTYEVGTGDVTTCTLYDGAAHTFAATAVDGWTASYSVYDSKSGKWNPVSAVTLTEIQDKATYVKVEWTAAGAQGPDASKTRYFHVNLLSAGEALIGFVPSEDGYLYTVPGTEYDAASYIDATPVVRESYSRDPEERAWQKFEDAAITKAVAANKTEMMAYFNELYEVQATTNEKTNPNVVTLTIAPKDLTSDQITEINKKYDALNDKIDISTGQLTARVALNGVDLSDYEIEFVKAPAKKVIKTKKSKTTKNVTIAVSAECKNGTIVKYKLINAPKKNITINANTGKITVKKGLAKGTYTFKIKAYVPASRNFFDGTTSYSEVQTMKVVVKKTKK